MHKCALNFTLKRKVNLQVKKQKSNHSHGNDILPLLVFMQ